MILGSGKGGSSNSQEEGSVIHAALLPPPSETRADLFSDDRPLLGILCVLFFSSLFLFSLVLNFPRMQMIRTEDDYDEECESSFVLYSLRNHHLVKRLPLSGPPSTFTANDQFIVVVSYHPIRLATNLLICFRRAWVHHLLSSFFHQQDSKHFILYHHRHLSHSCPYLIIVHLLLPLLLPPLLPLS